MLYRNDTQKQNKNIFQNKQQRRGIAFNLAFKYVYAMGVERKFRRKARGRGKKERVNKKEGARYLDMESASGRSHGALVRLPLVGLAGLGRRVFSPAKAVPKAPPQPVHPLAGRPLSLLKKSKVAPS